MGNDKTNIFLVAIVGIVAVAGLVFLFSGKGSATTEDSISGEAIFSKNPSCKMFDPTAWVELKEYKGQTGKVICEKAVKKRCVAVLGQEVTRFLDAEGKILAQDTHLVGGGDFTCDTIPVNEVSTSSYDYKPTGENPWKWEIATLEYTSEFNRVLCCS